MLTAPRAAAARTIAAHRRAAGGPLPWLKPGLFVGALVPLGSITLRALGAGLDANPIAQVENELGLAALIFLVASLTCTPFRRLFGWTWTVRVRRELGLFAFFYAGLHVLVYLFVDQDLDVAAILADVAKRPFITAGFLALVLLVPLAMTSTPASVRRLGFRRWQRLHQLSYAAAGLAVVHFVWRVKVDVSQPAIYAGVLAALLGVRVVFWVAGARQRTRPKTHSGAG